MSLFTVCLNILSVTSESRRARFDRDHQCLGVHICVLQETRFNSGDCDVILSREIDFFSAYYDGCSRRVSGLVSCSLKAVV